MINIWTDKHLINENCDFFNDCDLFVDSMVTAKDFSERDLEAIKLIDNAVVTDKLTGEVKTPYGLTNIENLSSGCKVVLTYLYIIRKKNIPSKVAVINVTECGENALNVLFKYADDDNRKDIVFYLGYVNRLGGCLHKDYLINNVHRIKDLSLIGGCSNASI